MCPIQGCEDCPPEMSEGERIARQRLAEMGYEEQTVWVPKGFVKYGHGGSDTHYTIAFKREG